MNHGLVCRIISTAMICGASSEAQDQGLTGSHTLEAGGLKRTYHVHLPAEPPIEQQFPLVFIFHGSGDNGPGMEAFSRFSTLADREKFIAVYPDAISQNWNDGREAASILSQLNKVDDVSFVSAMIREISSKHPVDPKRIHAAGFSNGGIFVHYLASHLSGQFAAIADVSGGIAEPFAAKFKPASPVSVFIIHGTKDPMVPFQGGDVDFGGFGRIIKTDDTIKLWLKKLEPANPPASGVLPDVNADDHCKVNWTRWKGSADSGCELLFYGIDGGGHTWPGGPQFLPVNVIGNVCRDVEATEAIWDFFSKHPRR